jgi:hypothetical protein
MNICAALEHCLCSEPVSWARPRLGRPRLLIDCYEHLRGIGAMFMFRTCLLGSASVGKTSLVTQCLTSDYMNTYDASLGKVVVN